VYSEFSHVDALENFLTTFHIFMFGLIQDLIKNKNLDYGDYREITVGRNERLAH